jgi:metal-responsive CopG/Arc/MetJ family transcriptional regulator
MNMSIEGELLESASSNDKRIDIRLDREFWGRIENRMKAEGYRGPTELLKDLLRRWLREVPTLEQGS